MGKKIIINILFFNLIICVLSQKNNSEIIDDILVQLRTLQKENESLKNELKSIKTEIFEQFKVLEPLLNPISEKTNFFKENLSKNSLIKTFKNFNFLNEALKSLFNLNIKKIKKIYQASKDGDTYKNFHENCDGFPNILVLIKTKNGNTFGGFTSKQWDSSCFFKDDSKAFLFSLDLHKIYPHKQNGKAIHCMYNFGPIFGFSSIAVGGHALEKDNLLTNSESDYYEFGELSNKEPFGEEPGKYVSIEDYEVYHITF